MGHGTGRLRVALKDLGCWRLCHVQTSSCMAAVRRTDEQRAQHETVLDYATDRGCDVIGLGGTRLGDDDTETCRMARGIVARARGEEACTRTLVGLDGTQRAKLLAARSSATRANWQSAGSHKDEYDIRRGGVALGSYDDAAVREFGVIDASSNTNARTRRQEHEHNQHSMRAAGAVGRGRQGRTQACEERNAERGSAVGQLPAVYRT